MYIVFTPYFTLFLSLFFQFTDKDDSENEEEREKLLKFIKNYPYQNKFFRNILKLHNPNDMNKCTHLL